MPLCWIFLLKRRRALSKVSFSPTRTSANRDHLPPARLGPGHRAPGAGGRARMRAWCGVTGMLARAAGDVGTSAARRAGGVYTSPADGSSDGSVTIPGHRRGGRYPAPQADLAIHAPVGYT